LSKRYIEFKKTFPKLKKLEFNEIAKLEPNVTKGRFKDESILALCSDEGYTVDYGKLSVAFADDAKRKGIDVYLNTKLNNITKENAQESKEEILEKDNKENKKRNKLENKKEIKSSNYFIKTDKEEFTAPVVIIATGAHSLMIAHSLGYGKEYGILSVAGSFYNAPKLLNGKVYTMQLKKLPFVAVHGDPEVHNSQITRFGPTAKPIFMLERYRYRTVGEYFKTLGFGSRQIATLWKLMSDKVVSKYIFRNYFYDWPIIGRRLFLKQVKKIVPSITLRQIKYAKGYGGNRPQIINLNKKTMDTGEAKIIGDDVIFNITPSPGASTCLGNAYIDVETVIGFLNKKGIQAKFDKKEFDKEFC